MKKIISIGIKIQLILISVFLFFNACNRPYCGPPKKNNDTTVTPTGCNPGLTNLEYYYPFNGNRTDVVVNKQAAVVNGTTFGQDKNLTAGSAVSFNGSGDYLAFNNGFDLFEKSFSIWFKTNTYPSGSSPTFDQGAIIVLDNPGLNYGLINSYVFNSGGTNYLSLAMGNSASGGQVTINMNAFGNPLGWHHIALVQKGTSIKIYLNAKIQINALVPGYNTSSSGSNNLILGTTRAMNGRYFNGLMDEFRFYDRALTDCEVKYLYDHYN